MATNQSKTKMDRSTGSKCILTRTFSSEKISKNLKQLDKLLQGYDRFLPRVKSMMLWSMTPEI